MLNIGIKNMPSKQASAGINWSGVYGVIDNIGRNKTIPYRISSKQSKLPYDIYVFTSSNGQTNIGVTLPMFSLIDTNRGNHGLVKQLICYDGSVYALKIQDQTEKKALAKEIYALKKTQEWIADFDIAYDTETEHENENHKNSMLGMFQSQVSAGDKLNCLIEKFYEGEDLAFFFQKHKVEDRAGGIRIKRLNLDNWKKMIIAQNMAISLQKLHNVNIGHNDIKPKNFLINGSTLNIGLVDFGEAQDNSDTNRPDAGNFYYGSPYTKDENMHSHMQRDIYSLGRIFEAELGLNDIFCDNDHIKQLIARMKTKVLDGAPTISEIIEILSVLNKKLGFRQMYEAVIGGMRTQHLQSAPSMICKKGTKEEGEEMDDLHRFTPKPE